MRVVEVFESIQGEGPLMGRRCVFVRLQGCNLGCSYCDSKYAERGWFWLEPNAIADAVDRFKTRNVVITGGEPTIQGDELIELTNQLLRRGKHITIETNGTKPSVLKQCHAAAIVISPKSQDVMDAWKDEVNRGSRHWLKIVVDYVNIDDICIWVRENIVRESHGYIYLMPKTDIRDLSDNQKIIQHMSELGLYIVNRLCEYEVDCAISPRLQFLFRVR